MNMETDVIGRDSCIHNARSPVTCPFFRVTRIVDRYSTQRQMSLSMDLKKFSLLHHGSAVRFVVAQVKAAFVAWVHKGRALL